jgi:hypothetical protein
MTDDQRQLLSRGSSVKPAVWKDITDGTPRIIKNLDDVPAWSRALARWLMNRERRVLRKLAGVEGVPQIVDEWPDGFAMALVPGEPLTAEAFEADPRGLADCLRRRIDAIHQRGVFHLDLKQRQNVLVAPPDQAYLVDFGAALAPGRLGRALWGRLLAWVDGQAVWKYLARHAPAELTLEEAKALNWALRLRRLWFVSPHKDRGERAAVRERIRNR